MKSAKIFTMLFLLEQKWSKKVVEIIDYQMTQLSKRELDILKYYLKHTGLLTFSDIAYALEHPIDTKA